MESRASKANILVVEDEATIRELLEAMLEPQDYVVRTAADGQEGLRTFFSWKPDLVFLDVMMPKMDGWKLLERIREVSDVPVIMLTALGMEHEKVRGLKGGADDYLTKPVSQGELLARVEAVLRRNKKTTFVESYHDPLLIVDFERHVVLKSGQEIDLSPTEFRLLAALVKHKGTVMSVERLLDTAGRTVSAAPTTFASTSPTSAESSAATPRATSSSRPSASSATATAPRNNNPLPLVGMVRVGGESSFRA